MGERIKFMRRKRGLLCALQLSRLLRGYGAVCEVIFILSFFTSSGDGNSLASMEGATPTRRLFNSSSVITWSLSCRWRCTSFCVSLWKRPAPAPVSGDALFVLCMAKVSGFYTNDVPNRSAWPGQAVQFAPVFKRHSSLVENWTAFKRCFLQNGQRRVWQES